MNPKILVLAILAITVGISQAQESGAEKSKLRCYSCNANLDICNGQSVDSRLKDYLVPCNGQCMKFKNQNDNKCTMIEDLLKNLSSLFLCLLKINFLILVWYRGCSNERFVGQQPLTIEDRGITFYFCDDFDGLVKDKTNLIGFLSSYFVHSYFRCNFF